MAEGGGGGGIGALVERYIVNGTFDSTFMGCKFKSVACGLFIFHPIARTLLGPVEASI